MNVHNQCMSTHTCLQMSDVSAGTIHRSELLKHGSERRFPRHRETWRAKELEGVRRCCVRCAVHVPCRLRDASRGFSPTPAHLCLLDGCTRTSWAATLGAYIIHQTRHTLGRFLFWGCIPAHSTQKQASGLGMKQSEIFCGPKTRQRQVWIWSKMVFNYFKDFEAFKLEKRYNFANTVSAKKLLQVARSKIVLHVCKPSSSLLIVFVPFVQRLREVPRVKPLGEISNGKQTASGHKFKPRLKKILLLKPTESWLVWEGRWQRTYSSGRWDVAMAENWSLMPALPLGTSGFPARPWHPHLHRNTASVVSIKKINEM